VRVGITLVRIERAPQKPHPRIGLGSRHRCATPNLEILATRLCRELVRK